MKKVKNSLSPRKVINRVRIEKLGSAFYVCKRKRPSKAMRSFVRPEAVYSPLLETPKVPKKDLITLTPAAPAPQAPTKMKIVPPTTITVPMPAPNAPPPSSPKPKNTPGK